MFCKKCGKEIHDGAVVCPHCGMQVAELRPAKDKTNVLAVVGFVFSFLIAIVGLICSIIGYNNADEYGGNGKGLAKAGIIISIVSMALSILIIIVYACIIGSMLGPVYYY